MIHWKSEAASRLRLASASILAGCTLQVMLGESSIGRPKKGVSSASGCVVSPIAYDELRVYMACDLVTPKPMPKRD